RHGDAALRLGNPQSHRRDGEPSSPSPASGNARSKRIRARAMIISRTPFRVSLFGGGSDYPQWYEKNGGAVLGFAIKKYCYISLRPLPPFFEYKHRIVYSKVEMANAVGEIQHPAVRHVLDDMKVDYGVEIHHDGDLPA